MLWTHASTTTACNRLPSLVTLIEADDEEEDREYMGLALYLSLSECGFFVSWIWNLNVQSLAQHFQACGFLQLILQCFLLKLPK